MMIPELGIYTRKGPVDLGGKGRSINIPIRLPIPDDTQPGEYTIRVSISNDDTRRTIHRETVIRVSNGD